LSWEGVSDIFGEQKRKTRLMIWGLQFATVCVPSVAANRNLAQRRKSDEGAHQVKSEFLSVAAFHEGDSRYVRPGDSGDRREGFSAAWVNC
jgi:hypothetical protein